MAGESQGMGCCWREIAGSLQVTVRTLWNWEHRHPGRAGRRPHPPEAHRSALWAVARQMRLQGQVGWRPVCRALGRDVPVVLVQRSVKALKERRRARARRHREAVRVSVEVLATGAVVVRDGFQGCGTYGEVTRDRATLRTGVSCGESPETGREVAGRLDREWRMGAPPLVLGTDNGSAYKSWEVRECLNRWRVVHLRSEPHVPQQNGAAECAVKEVKAEAGLGRGSVPCASEGAARRLEDACERLNTCRLRGSRGYRTAAELDKAPSAVHSVERARFYGACQRRIREALQVARTVREARRARREAIWQTLEAFGLVRRYRGGVPIPPALQEIIS